MKVYSPMLYEGIVYSCMLSIFWGESWELQFENNTVTVLVMLSSLTALWP